VFSTIQDVINNRSGPHKYAIFIFHAKHTIRKEHDLQLNLLRKSWKDIFILDLAHWGMPWDLRTIWSARIIQLKAGGHIKFLEDQIMEMGMKFVEVLRIF